ncbi:unnamed protein product [Urochloa decumbens]|uniref:GATA-type domain-containing protein n=1 Tax=Urochloa decumbens TaxID=240449 RepID=A0ABC8VQE6_9POAL
MLQELAPCACGRFYCGGRCAAAASSSAFSMLFPMAAEQRRYKEEDGPPPYGAGGPVDCTLSLGTPSTRRAEAGVVHARAGAGGAGNNAAAPCNEATGRASPPGRRCANCDTTSTPLWRNGPRGPKSLCNACGIRYKKEERRAAAAVAPAPAPMQDSGGLVGSYACGGYARQQHPPHQPQWGCYGVYGGGGDAAGADGHCLSWMLNAMPSSPAFAVRERPSLFQYY